LKTKKPRYILSIEQQQQNAVNKKSPIIHDEKAKGNEESIIELVQNDHEVVLERIRSPDIDMQRNGTSAIVTVNVDDKLLTEDISLLDEFEKHSLKKLCPNPEDNRK
ncbi:unnamed protein product, partial [Onchocerca flexuosa]